MIRAQHTVQTATAKAAILDYFTREYGPVLADMLVQQFTTLYIDKHVTGDWGVCEDADQNEFELEHGGRAMSVFRLGKLKLWVISDGVEPRDSAGNNAAYSTTLLLPEDY